MALLHEAFGLQFGKDEKNIGENEIEEKFKKLEERLLKLEKMVTSLKKENDELKTAEKKYWFSGIFEKFWGLFKPETSESPAEKYPPVPTNSPTKSKISSDDGYRKLAPQEVSAKLGNLMKQRYTEIPDIGIEKAKNEFEEFMKERNNIVDKIFEEYMAGRGYMVDHVTPSSGTIIIGKRCDVEKATDELIKEGEIKEEN